MAGHTLIFEKDFNGCLGEADIDLLFDQLIGVLATA